MKKNFKPAFFCLPLLAAVLVCAAACEEGAPHSDPSFLQGSWSNPEGTKTFSVSGDGSFASVVLGIPPVTGVLEYGAMLPVNGKFEYNNDLDPDDYILKDLSLDSDAKVREVNKQYFMSSPYSKNDADATALANIVVNMINDPQSVIKPSILAVNGAVVTIKPKDNKTKFVFSSTDSSVQQFFAGTYQKL